MVQLLSIHDSPFFLGGYSSLQSTGVVEGVDEGIVIDVVEAIVAFVVVPNKEVVDCAVVLGIGVVVHEEDWISTSQDALQYAT